MQISQFVEDIIARRNAKIPVIEGKRQELYGILKALDSFDDLKYQIVDDNGEVLPGKYQYLAAKDPAIAIKLGALSTRECREKIDTALDACDTVTKRFSRDRINISVVGKARIGKSRLLQSITDLDAQVIPTSDLTDCTGAVSVIENDPSMEAGKVKATITFKSEKQIVETVQTYLDVMIEDPGKKIVIRSLRQIRELDLDDIARRMPQFSAHTDKLVHLERYVKNYEEWISLVDSAPVVLTDKAEIQTYVAQHDNNDKRFNKYLAVDSCHIRCGFHYSEAGKITLLDSVGLEDTAIGIMDDLLKLVNEESDAVIFLHKPENGAGGGFPKSMSDIYQEILKGCPNRDLNHWLFWLINEDKRINNSAYLCKTAMDILNKRNWAGEIRKIIDVSDQDQVREQFLIPLLQHLRDHLNDIDKLYTDDLQKALDVVRKEFNSFCASAKKVMSSQINTAANILPEMHKDVAIAQKHRTGSLRKLALEEKKLRDVSCDVLFDRVRDILDDMDNGSMIPTKEEILGQIQCGDEPGKIYIDYCNRLRNGVTQRFSGVDGALTDLVEGVKNQIAQILYADEACRLGRIMAMSDGEKPYMWLKDFADTTLEPEAYPNLNTAFMNVYNFDFSVRGFLTYEVRACMDVLDPQISNSPHNLIVENDDDRTAERIRHWLDRNLRDVAEELEASLSDLFNKPHRAFFAIIKEFSDKVDFSEEVQDEWLRLYSENYPVVWSEKYQGMAVANNAFAEWNDMLKNLLDCNSRCAALQVV